MDDSNQKDPVKLVCPIRRLSVPLTLQPSVSFHSPSRPPSAPSRAQQTKECALIRATVTLCHSAEAQECRGMRMLKRMLDHRAQRMRVRIQSERPGSALRSALEMGMAWLVPDPFAPVGSASPAPEEVGHATGGK